MTKRRRDDQEIAQQKKQKIETSKKRPSVFLDVSRVAKRAKVYEYWHMAPLSRFERAQKMAAIYERLCCTA